MKPFALLLFIPGLAFGRAAKEQLALCLPPATAAAVWGRAVALHRELHRTQPRHSLGVNLLLRCADHAMYQAKKAGKNRFQFFSQRES